MTDKAEVEAVARALAVDARQGVMSFEELVENNIGKLTYLFDASRAKDAAPGNDVWKDDPRTLVLLKFAHRFREFSAAWPGDFVAPAGLVALKVETDIMFEMVKRALLPTPPRND